MNGNEHCVLMKQPFDNSKRVLLKGALASSANCLVTREEVLATGMHQEDHVPVMFVLYSL